MHSTPASFAPIGGARPQLWLVADPISPPDVCAARSVASYSLTGYIHGIDKPARTSVLVTFLEGLLEGEGLDIVHCVSEPGVQPLG